MKFRTTNLLAKVLFFSVLLAIVPVKSSLAKSNQKLRLLVLTDISSLTAKTREPDDAQSLIRLMLYANEFEIEGLIASSNLGHGQVVRPELIRQIVETYGAVRPNLLRHRSGYPSAQSLLARVKAGQPHAGVKIPVQNSIGEGRDTEASNWIIKVVDKRDERPVWVTIWGGSADLAQALWRVRETRSPAEVARFVAKLRVHAIYDQDSTSGWIKSEFPNLFYITRHHGVRGMYRGGDAGLVSPEWVERHIRIGHGALGRLYPNYDGGDIWVRRLGPVRGIKEGDTPSFLYLIPNGLNEPAQPMWGGWGGRFQLTDGNARRYTDARDDYSASTTDPDDRMSAVYRWRADFQADFAARMDWCVQSFGQANHPPQPHVKGALARTVAPGAPVVLDASRSRDPDADALSFEWFHYKEAGTYHEPLHISGSASPVASFKAPNVSSPQTIHVILIVRDGGAPNLAAYRRIVITVNPQ